MANIGSRVHALGLDPTKLSFFEQKKGESVLVTVYIPDFSPTEGTRNIGGGKTQEILYEVRNPAAFSIALDEARRLVNWSTLDTCGIVGEELPQ